ncbi:MAG: DUF1564 family protein [Leptospiraceae bacterium]|nr:DUF1564 family protein [Leptospiraceae bacterium]MBL0265836.1 DUF1564 family protein [Leptospiraceae bacterium]MBP9164070.1 DUF1564 family protein [Leptospiraceae bacterium]
MRTFIEKKQFNSCKDLNEPSTRSSLLIPARHMSFFLEKVESHGGSVALYLSHLLRRYRFLIQNGCLEKHPFVKTGYQQKQQGLRRVDFVPLAVDWAELKCLRAFLNRSMTWIFVSLLLIDSLDLDKNLPEKYLEFVVPKKSYVRLMVNATLSRKRAYYDRFLQMTRDRTG